MKKTMTMMKKLAWLAVMALPLVTVGDIQQSLPWDENVMEPVILFDARDWRYWSVFAAVFIIVISLTIWWGRRRSKKCRFPNCTFHRVGGTLHRVGVYVPSTSDYVALEVLGGAAIAALLCVFGGASFGRRERVIHHPAERPDRYINWRCDKCGAAIRVSRYSSHVRRLCDRCNVATEHDNNFNPYLFANSP